MFLRALLAAALLHAPHVAARVPTGLNPCGAAAGFGSVWVANDGSGTLARIDPRTSRVTRRIVLGKGACFVAAGAGAVWVTNYDEDTVERVDPSTLEVTRTKVSGVAWDVVVARGRVWATNWSGGELLELAPHTGAVIRRVDVGTYSAGMRYAAGALWVGFGRDVAAIARVDLETLDVEHVRIGVRAPAWFVAGTSDLWIQAGNNRVVHLDPATRRVLGVRKVGFTIAQGALAADGTIWMPDKQVDTIYRLDPRTGRVVDSFPGGDGAFHALRAFGSMWVTSYAGADVWRFA